MFKLLQTYHFKFKFNEPQHKQIVGRYLIQHIMYNQNILNLSVLNSLNSFGGATIQKLLINTANTTNQTYNGVSTYQYGRICGFIRIRPGSTDTYTFQRIADDGAILYINDTLLCNGIFKQSSSNSDYFTYRRFMVSYYYLAYTRYWWRKYEY